jgi:hypothetical protein
VSGQPPAAAGPPPVPSSGSLRCPRCSATVGPEQDWCLECGAPARTRLAQTPNWQLPTVAIGAIILVAGAMLAFAFVKLTGDGGAPAATPAVTPAAPAAAPPVAAPAAPAATTPPPAATVPTQPATTATTPAATTQPATTATTPAATTPGKAPPPAPNATTRTTTTQSATTPTRPSPRTTTTP